MSLTNYILNGPSTVILDDNRDPFESWRRHERTTGRGGVDLVAKVGTPVLAPTDGWLDQCPNDGSAGNSSRFRHQLNKGWSDVFSHLSAYAGNNGKFYRQGEVVALSGDSGAPGQPHLHRHLLDPKGVRQNPWLYFNTPVTLTPQEENMTQAVRLNKKHLFTIGEEFLSHNGTQAQADITRKINSASDELHDVDTTSFYDYLDGMGIPRNAVDLNTGAVLNPETGKLEVNGVWSRRRESVAKESQILALLSTLTTK